MNPATTLSLYVFLSALEKTPKARRSEVIALLEKTTGAEREQRELLISQIITIMFSAPAKA